MRPLALAALLAAVAPPTLATPALAQPGVERWTAVSTTASGITGDIRLSPSRLQTANASLPLAVAADVPAFKTDTGSFPARILRVTRPANPLLLNANRFCTAPVRWIVVWRDKPGPKGNLGMAVFSGEAQPSGEDDPGLCGTFYYQRG